MRRPHTTTVPEAEPTVSLGPARAQRGEWRAQERVVLDRYRLDRRLGAGGFGVVWRAHDLKLERDVAVKVVPRSGSDSVRSRTEREALAAARLNHPGIVALYEFGYDANDIYLVSELVEGATLGELNEEGVVSDYDVARIGLALCEALAHAHARGVVHRDLKPDNVMVLAEPAAGSGFAKLTDLGIAHVASAAELTAPGDVVGTLAYMAPEQAEGRPVTAACDVYSLALTLYEAWTGTNPVRAQGPAATARRVGLALPPLRSLRRDLPPELGEVVDAALDPDPAYRPSPAELRAVLSEVEDGLSDEGGLVEPETMERFGLTAVRARTRLATLMHRAPPPGRVPAGGEASPRRIRALLARVAAGIAAGSLSLAAFAGLGAQLPFSPLGLVGAVAVAVVLFPRLGWLFSAAGICLWLAAAGLSGTAVVLACAIAITPVLLPRAGTLWSLPALAPLLGTMGIAPLFVGLAALAPTPWRRAGLGAAGFAWLAVYEVLSDRRLLFGVADGTLPSARWEGSAINAVGDAVLPLLSTPALAPALVWGAFAWLLSLLVRGRWLAMDVMVAGLWAIGLVAVHESLGEALTASTTSTRAQSAALGAVLGALVAVAAALLAPPTPRDVTARPRITLSPDS